MAKCDEGYLCDVCGQDVAELTDSDLYLRYIVGMLDPEVLHTTAERHIRCNPTLAQYIVADDFEPSSSRGRSISDSSIRNTSASASGSLPAVGIGSKKSPRWAFRLSNTRCRKSWRRSRLVVLDQVETLVAASSRCSTDLVPMNSRPSYSRE